MIENTRPLVTVIVISYNHGKYIRQNLDSIKNQSYNNIELVVADDASTDRSVETFNLWLTENNFTAKKLFHKTNTGLNTLLNECFPLISGKYVKLIAADDYLHDDYLQECVEQMESLGDSYGLVYTNIHSINDNGENVEFVDYDKFWVDKTKESFRQELKCANRIAAVSVLLSTNALFTTGRYNKDLLIEDYDRWLRINEKFWITYIPKKLAYYRFHGHNTSTLKQKQIEEETMFLLLKYAEKENKDTVNSKMRNYYLKGNKISKKMISAYKAIVFKEKLLFYFMSYNLPTKLYRLIRK